MRNNRITIYKPHSDKAKGSALQFSVGSVDKGKFRNPVLWVEMANQIKDKPDPGSREPIFDWSNKVVIMLSTDEAGDVLATIRGMTKSPSIKLYHDFDRGGVKKVTQFSLNAPDPDGKYENWRVFLSCKLDGREVFNNSILLTPGEVMQLALACEMAIKRIFEDQEVYASSEDPTDLGELPF